MASRKDLAGLAALGALGYMLNRDKGASRDTDTGVDVQPSYANRRPTQTEVLAQNPLMSNMGDSSNTTGEYAPGPSRMMRPEPTIRPRPRPVVRPAAPAAPAVSPASQQTAAGDQSWNTVTPQEMERRKRMEQQQALEAVRPEEAMIGGGGLKTVAALARGLAGRKGAAATGEKLAEYITPELGYTQKLLQAPAKQLTGPSKAELVARDRAARAAAREAERTNFNRYTNELGAADLPYKKGGKVKKMAKGGMTSKPVRSSASKRGDGIASKGKTRGRIY